MAPHLTNTVSYSRLPNRMLVISVLDMCSGTTRRLAASNTLPVTPVIHRALWMSCTAIQQRSYCMLEDSTLMGNILLQSWCIVSAEDSAAASDIPIVCCGSSLIPFNSNCMNSSAAGMCCCKSRFYRSFMSFGQPQKIYAVGQNALLTLK